MRDDAVPDVLAEGAYLRLVRRDGWEYAERIGASGVVVIVAITETGRLILAEQYRTPVARPVIELPAGLVGDRPGGGGEVLTTAAKRELLEETGYEARDFAYLAEGPSSAGLTSEIVTFLRATGLRRVGPGGGDRDEEIRVHEVPLSEIALWLDGMARRGYLIDSKVFAGLYLLDRGGSAPTTGRELS